MAVRSVDQRVLGAGTTVRFGLLLMLLLAAGASAMSEFLSNIADLRDNALGCILASGVDPDTNSGWLANLVRPIATGDNTALDACVTHYVHSAPWWEPMLGIGLLLAVAGTRLARALRVRRRRCSRRGPGEDVREHPSSMRRATIGPLLVVPWTTRIARSSR